MSRRKGKNYVPQHGRNARRHARTRAKRYLVVCGGQATEPEYFEHCNAAMGLGAIRVISKTMAPSQLAKYAVKCKEDDERNSGPDDCYAAIFVVVDVDDYHDHRRAQRICKDNGIRLVISNPCFEVWLVDHVRQCPAAYADTASVERYAAELEVVEGSRNKYINFKAVEGHMQDAKQNAKRHNSAENKAAARRLLEPQRESGYAPWTDMPDVIETLGWAEQKSKKEEPSARRE